MAEISDPFDEALARIRAADRLALWALVTVERLSVALGQPSPIDRIAREIDTVDPTATPFVGRDLQVQERASEIIAGHLAFLQSLRAAQGEL